MIFVLLMSMIICNATVTNNSHKLVNDLMESTFCVIKATHQVDTGKEHTPFFFKHTVTVAYIHALMIDTLTLLSTEHPEPCSACTLALRNERVVLEDLEVNKDVFQLEVRTELRDCLVDRDYYENILKMDGAGGMPWSSTFKGKFKTRSISTAAAPAAAAAGAPPAAPPRRCQRSRRRRRSS